jgi:MFS family permease
VKDEFAAFRSRDYSIFWVAAVISNTGNWMQTITVPFVIFQLTHSTTWVGFTAFMAFGPALLMGPIAGSLADRLPRKYVVLVTQSGMMLAAFALYALWVTDTATPGLIVGVLALAGFSSGLGFASWQSFIPQLVPHEDLLSAIRLNSSQFTAARAFGPALAGFVFKEFGASTAFLANALSFVIVIVALVAVRPRAIEMPAKHPRVLEHFRTGVKYVRERRALALPVITIFVLSFFGSSIVQLSAPLARVVFDVGKTEYGFLVGAFGGGALVGTIISLLVGDRVLRSSMAMTGLALFAGSEILLGGAPGYLVGVIGLFGMGVAYTLVAVALNTSIQARVAESHRGRVLSMYLMGLLAGVPLGALTAGALAGALGLRATIIAGGSALLAFTVFGTIAFERMTPLDEALETLEPVHADALLTNQPAITGAD